MVQLFSLPGLWQNLGIETVSVGGLSHAGVGAAHQREIQLPVMQVTGSIEWKLIIGVKQALKIEALCQTPLVF